MKIGFKKGNLTLNGKNFNPLNLTVNGHGIEFADELPKIDAFELLGKLAAARAEGKSRADQLNVLQSALPK